jgi:hypothetical protein
MTTTASTSRDSRTRLQLGALALASLILCLACLGIMVNRIVAFHRENPRVFYQFNRIDAREFNYADRPVTITDEPETGPADAVLVRFGDQTLRIRRTLPPGIDGLPGLQEHADWLRVMRFADASGISDEEFHKRLGTSELPDRLAIITRSSRPGANPESWGKVWKRDWSFDLYELKADGTIEHERLRYPTATRMKEPKPGELHENTWQFQQLPQRRPRRRRLDASRLDVRRPDQRGRDLLRRRPAQAPRAVKPVSRADRPCAAREPCSRAATACAAPHRSCAPSAPDARP